MEVGTIGDPSKIPLPVDISITRDYSTSSLLANWDKGGDDNEQFLRGFSWNGRELTQRFAVDFTKEKLGPPTT